MNKLINTATSLYHSVIEWIVRHITVVYFIEITLIGVLCLYGLASKNGFRASGY